MNALIFAAGLGTRLKPLTDTMPKALVPVGGRPLIQILIEKLYDSGFNNLVINVHHFAEQIVTFISDHYDFGMEIRYSDERRLLLDTGGGLRKGAPTFPDFKPILVHNVDILSNKDLGAFYTKCYNRPGQPTTLLTSDRSTSRYLVSDESGRLVGWTNITTGQIKSPYPELMAHNGEVGYFATEGLPYSIHAFSGIHFFNINLLPLMDSWPKQFSIIDFYLSICHEQTILIDNDPELLLLDVGKLDSIAQAEQFLQSLPT